MGYTEQEAKMAISTFTQLLKNNIAMIPDMPVKVKDELLNGIERVFVKMGNNAVGYGNVFMLGPTKPSIVSGEGAFLPNVYNDPNSYYKQYKANNPRSYIMYYPNKKHPSKYGPFPLNKPFGKGTDFFENTIKQFKELYPDVDVTMNQTR